MDVTTTKLLEEIKRKISAPDTQDLYTDAEFCDAMGDVQNSTIVPWILSTLEDYFLEEIEYVLTASQTEVLLPPRAIGLKVQSVGRRTRDGNIRELSQVTQRQLNDEIRAGNQVYAMRGPYIKLPSAVSNTDNLVVSYYRRPSMPVPVTAAGKIINVAGNVITLDNVPGSWAVDKLMDVHSGTSPFRPVHDDVTIASINGFDITLTGDPIVEVGQYVCEMGQCVIPQIPYELFPILTTYASLQFLQSYGTGEEASLLSQNYAELKENLFQMVTPRTTSRPKGVTLGAHFRYWR